MPPFWAQLAAISVQKSAMLAQLLTRGQHSGVQTLRKFTTLENTWIVTAPLSYIWEPAVDAKDSTLENLLNLSRGVIVGTNRRSRTELVDWATIMGGMVGAATSTLLSKSLIKLIKVTIKHSVIRSCTGNTNYGVMSKMGPMDTVIRKNFPECG